MGKDCDAVAGIDLGTTNSCVCIFRNESVSVVTDPQGKRTTPSVVSFSKTGRQFGKIAKDQMERNFKNTVYDVKRLIGLNFTDPSVQEDMKHWGFTVTPDENGKPMISVEYGGKECLFTPEEISSMIIEYLVGLASSFSGKKIKHIVITVPAYFNDNQRRATMDAGEIAGYNVLGVLNEPTAAAIAYGLENNENNKKILVYDLGGGTFDVTILSIVDRKYTVLTTGGDTHLGGDDLDIIMMGIMEDALSANGHPVDTTNMKMMSGLRKEAEAIKIALSQTESYEWDADKYDCEESIMITRIQFEEKAKTFFDKTFELLEKVLAEIKLKVSDIDDVVLIGGSSRIPIIKTRLQEMFGENRVYEKINPDEAVAKGAVIQAVKLYRELPADDDSGSESGSGNESESESEEGLNPDSDNGEKVDSGVIATTVLTDVVPLPIGLKTHEGTMSMIIPRCTPYGQSFTRSYTTSSDNATRMKIRVYQGERLLVKDNYEIGSFKVTGITPLPAGEASVDVTMGTDKNGLLTVTAFDCMSGKETSVTFENKSTNLSMEAILEMRRKATEMREIDRKIAEKLKLYNQIEAKVYSVSSLYEEYKDSMDPTFKQGLEQFLDGIKTFLKSRDAEQEELEEKDNLCQKWIDAFRTSEEYPVCWEMVPGVESVFRSGRIFRTEMEFQECKHMWLSRSLLTEILSAMIEKRGGKSYSVGIYTSNHLAGCCIIDENRIGISME